MATESAVRTRSELVRLLEARSIAFETIESGQRWAIVTPALAARIMGAGIGEENAFWVSPSDGWNAGGQRTWIAPEGGPSGFFYQGSTWSVPPDLDPGHYRAASAEPGWRSWQTELSARNAAGSSRRISLTRSVKLEKVPGSPGAMIIHFRHELGNLGSSPLDRRVGLWGLIQLPCEEPCTIFLSLQHRGARLTPYFGGVPTLDSGDDGKLGWMSVMGGTRFKAGISPADFPGTLGFVRRSRLPGAPRSSVTLTAMTFETDPGGAYVDRSPASWAAPVGNGDAAQVYGDPGTGPLAFCEIEAHAPAPLLPPGETMRQDIAITIASLAENELEGLARNLGMPALPSEAVNPG